MKAVLLALLTLTTADSASAFERPVYVHPFESIVVSLTSSLEELRKTRGAGSEDLQKRVDRLHQKASSLAKRALLLPLTLSDAKVARYGAKLVVSNPFTFRQDFVYDDRFSEMRSEAFQLQPSRWISVAAEVDANYARAESAFTLWQRPGVDDSLLKPDSDEVFGLTVGRRTALTNLRSNIKATLECIDFFTKAFDKNGLKPIGSGTELRFSETELNRIYGVTRLSALSPPNRITVKKALTELNAKVPENFNLCISVETAVFLQSAEESL